MRFGDIDHDLSDANGLGMAAEGLASREVLQDVAAEAVGEPFAFSNYVPFAIARARHFRRILAVRLRDQRLAGPSPVSAREPDVRAVPNRDLDMVGVVDEAAIPF